MNIFVPASLTTSTEASPSQPTSLTIVPARDRPMSGKRISKQWILAQEPLLQLILRQLLCTGIRKGVCVCGGECDAIETKLGSRQDRDNKNTVKQLISVPVVTFSLQQLKCISKGEA